MQNWALHFFFQFNVNRKKETKKKVDELIIPHFGHFTCFSLLSYSARMLGGCSGAWHPLPLCVTWTWRGWELALSSLVILETSSFALPILILLEKTMLARRKFFLWYWCCTVWEMGETSFISLCMPELGGLEHIVLYKLTLWDGLSCHLQGVISYILESARALQRALKFQKV